MSKQADIFKSITLCASLTLTGIPSVLAQGVSDEVSGVVFDMKGCQRQRKALICTGRITSTERDALLVLDSLNTSLTDESGDQYIAESVQAGAPYNYGMTNLIRNVPLKTTIVFRNIPNNNKSIPLITFATKFTGTFQLKNINISN